MLYPGSDSPNNKEQAVQMLEASIQQQKAAAEEDRLRQEFKAAVTTRLQTIPIPKPKQKPQRRRFELKPDHYQEHKTEQEFFQKKLMASQHNVSQREEIRSLENLAREQSDVLVCFITEVLYHLLTSNGAFGYKSKAKRKTEAELTPSPQTQEKKSFFSLQNLKSFIKNALKRNKKGDEEDEENSATSTTETANTTTTTTIFSPIEELPKEPEEEKGKAEIHQFLQRIISKIPVDPRLHVVGLMYFDRLIQSMNPNCTASPFSSFDSSDSSVKQNYDDSHLYTMSPTSKPMHKTWASSIDLSQPQKKNSFHKRSVSTSCVTQLPDKQITLETYHKYYAMCIVLASKMWEDRFYSLRSYYELFDFANTVNFSTFNECEGLILSALSFELFVTYDSFRDYIEYYSKILNAKVYKRLGIPSSQSN
jgi:hypothetical protein